MDKLYHIFLNKKKIGITHLEKADVPMGVVFGEIIPVLPEFGYLFLQNYLLENDISFDDYPETLCLSSRTIPKLTIINQSTGVEISGLGNQISGMEGEGFEVSIEGIAYPFYEEEFPHHVKEYDQ